MPKRLFGVSTHLYRMQRLSREHLLEIASQGFEAVELLAAPTHADYHNPAAVADLQQWLAEAGLELTSIHRPADIGTAGDSGDVDQALFIARRIPVKVFVVHMEGTRDVARRTVERLAGLAAPLGVKIALEAAPDDASPPGSLVHVVEEELDAEVGIALDLGREHRHGDLIDAIETVAEHLMAVHVPLESTIDWPSALTTVQKIGYEGPLIFGMDARGSTKETLARAKAARQQMERLLAL